jgi:peptidoglycan/xylan/chitin deacetylase (PgdA/CDA1 family)
MRNWSVKVVLALLPLASAASCSSAPSSPTAALERVGSVSERLSLVGVATWKNDATGAYTIHHDDAGSIFSITNYIVPQLNSRGLTAGLGAIAGLVQANAADQVPKLTAAAAAGHEIMSHSWTHVLQGNTAACPGVTMTGCADGLGGQKEVVDSKNWLEANLNTQVTYFMYPYDYRETDVAALVAQYYLGDRSGWDIQGAAQGVNPADFGDYNDAFEAAGLDPIPDGDLNAFVDQIIAAGGWGIRELHGVDDGTWGHVTSAQYTAHLNYIQAKRDAGVLWVANPTAAIKYKHLRDGDCGSPQLAGNTLTFSNSGAAACGKYHTVVSVKISDPSSTLTASQAGHGLEVLNKGGSNWIVNVDPTLGATTISTSGTVTCVPENDTALCAGVGATCGTITATDNCGTSRTVSSCGTCAAPATCGGGGTANVCGGGSTGCAQAYDQAHCNTTSPLYGTGSQVSLNGHNYTCANNNCRMCTSYASCAPGGSGCPWGAVWTDNGACGGVVTCTPETGPAFCSRLGANCGSVTASDNCGTTRTVSCGTCTSPQTCGGGGTANVCGGTSCTPEGDTTFCSSLGKNCGTVTGTDNCGASRTVTSCGSCTAPQTCGGGGTSNVCGGGQTGSACATAYSQGNCLAYQQGTQVSSAGHNWTCSNGNCANCAGYASCAPGGSGCPWGVVWTDNGACH